MGRERLPPDRAHPLVKRLFQEMVSVSLTQKDMCRKAGINESTMRGWRDGSSPGVANLEACFNVVGLKLDLTRLN